VALGRELSARHRGDPVSIVRELLYMFRTQPFVYTLEPPRLADNAVDEFLFSTRKGFCEHYASAFTIVMRAAGIPARIVTGYQGGEFNPYGGISSCGNPMRTRGRKCGSKAAAGDESIPRPPLRPNVSRAA
jgi:transglutaminase-like putative cysteine protease